METTTAPHAPRTIEQVGVDALAPYARNSRTHSREQVAEIAASIREFGFTCPVLIDVAGGIIAGHGRVMAAKKLGLAAVPCIRLAHLTEAQKRAYVIADNKLAMNAGWDDELLALEMRALESLNFDLALTGFDSGEIDAMLADMGDAEGQGSKDAESVPEIQPEPISKPGDVWVLGRHRVMCGDSTRPEQLEHLLGAARADLIFTDPPYGVSYADKNKSLNESVGGNRIQTEIENDHLKGDEIARFFLAAFSAMFAVMKPGCPFYVCAPQGGEQMMMMMMQKAGLPVRHELIWVKNCHVLGRADYHYKHEPILYGWKEGAGHPWYGDRDKFSVWHVDKPKASKLHPTMKPVELVEIAIGNSSRRGDFVLDLFGGSGSTLIACEKTGRDARLMELSPNYVDVIVRRWQDYTGGRAVHAESGAPFA